MSRVTATKGQPLCYKFGLVLLAIVLVVFLIGFVSPFWVVSEFSSQLVIGSVQYAEGLWMFCTDRQDNAFDCAVTGLIGFPAWYHGVRGLLCLCMGALVMALLYAVISHCCPSTFSLPARTLETLTAVAGVTGFTGCMIYLGLRRAVTKELSGFFVILTSELTWTLDWAFYVSALSSGLAILVAVLIAVSRKPTAQTPSPTSMAMTNFQPGLSMFAGLPMKSSLLAGPYASYGPTDIHSLSDPQDLRPPYQSPLAGRHNRHLLDPFENRNFHSSPDIRHLHGSPDIRHPYGSSDIRHTHGNQDIRSSYGSQEQYNHLQPYDDDHHQLYIKTKPYEHSNHHPDRHVHRHSFDNWSLHRQDSYQPRNMRYEDVEPHVHRQHYQRLQRSTGSEFILDNPDRRYTYNRQPGPEPDYNIGPNIYPHPEHSYRKTNIYGDERSFSSPMYSSYGAAFP